MNNAKPIPDLPAIEGMIRLGVEQGLCSLFDISSEAVVFVASTDRMRVAKRLTTMKEGPDAIIKYPYLFVSMPTVSQGIVDQMHAYNAKSITRHGQYIKVNDDEKSVLRVSLVPAIFEFEILYMVDDFNKAFKYSNRWITHGTNNRMNFSLTYAGVSVDVRCIMADTMSTPPRDESIDQPNVFEYTSSLRVAGYITDDYKDGRKLVEMIRADKVNVTMRDSTVADKEFVYSPSRQQQVWSK